MNHNKQVRGEQKGDVSGGKADSRDPKSRAGHKRNVALGSCSSLGTMSGGDGSAPNCICRPE